MVWNRDQDDTAYFYRKNLHDKAVKVAASCKDLPHVKKAVFLPKGIFGDMLNVEKKKHTTDEIARYAKEHGNSHAAKEFRVSKQAVSYHIKKFNNAGS